MVHARRCSVRRVWNEGSASDEAASRQAMRVCPTPLRSPCACPPPLCTRRCCRGRTPARRSWCCWGWPGWQAPSSSWAPPPCSPSCSASSSDRPRCARPRRPLWSPSLPDCQRGETPSCEGGVAASRLWQTASTASLFFAILSLLPYPFSTHPCLAPVPTSVPCFLPLYSSSFKLKAVSLPRILCCCNPEMATWCNNVANTCPACAPASCAQYGAHGAAASSMGGGASQRSSTCSCRFETHNTRPC